MFWACPTDCVGTPFCVRRETVFKRVFALEHHACEQVQRQEQGLRCARLPHDEQRRANAHTNEKRKRHLPDGIVPSDAHFQVE